MVIDPIFFRFIQKNYPEVEIYVEMLVLDGLKKINKDLKLPLLFVNNEESLRKIEYIITLGGDGTILWATKMFHGDYIPPLISFSHGSLGYLCNFLFEEF